MNELTLSLVASTLIFSFQIAEAKGSEPCSSSKWYLNIVKALNLSAMMVQ